MSPEDQAFIDAQGGAGGTQVMLSPGDEAFIRDALKAEGQGTIPPASVASPGQPPAPWGLADSLAQGATLGGYAPGLAYARSAFYGTPYSMERGRLASGQEAYKTEAPTRALLGELGGSLPTTIGAMALGQEYAAAPLGARIAAMAPNVSKYISAGEGLAPWLLRAGGRLAGYMGEGVISNEMQTGLTGQDPWAAAKSGAVIGGLLGPVGSGLSYGLKSNIAGPVADMARRFTDLGVPLKSGQIPGAPIMTKPFAHASGDQVSSWNQALSHTIGEDSASLSNGLLFGPQGAARRVGDTMESITAGHSIPISQPILSATQNLRQQALSDLATKPAAQARVLQHLDNIDSTLHAQGDMTGAQFHAMTKFGSPLYRDLAGKDPDLSHYASEIKGALDDAWGAALPPDKLAAWTQAKQQYKNIMTLKPAIDETTQQADPNLLYRSVERKNRGSTANAGDLGTLAEGGVNFLAPHMGSAAKHVGPIGMLGAGALGLAAEHAAPLLESEIFQHPLATGAAAMYGLGNLGAGALMSRPGYANLLMRGQNPAATMLPQVGIPAATYLYGQGGQQ